jgi:hypothetical protein
MVIVANGPPSWTASGLVVPLPGFIPLRGDLQNSL